MFLAIFLIGLIVVPPIVNEVEAFAGDVPNYITDIRSNKTLREYDDKYKITKKLEEQAKNLPSKLGQAAGALQAVTVGVFSTVIQLVTVLTITFFLLLDGGRIVNFILAQVRPEHQDRVRQIAADIYSATGGYVAGALALATAAGISTYIVLSILGVPFAVPLAVLMAFFDLIPLVGSTIGGVLVGVVTVFGDFPGDTIIWVIYVIVYQQVENSVFQPFVYRRAVNLHPLAVITAILIGVEACSACSARWWRSRSPRRSRSRSRTSGRTARRPSSAPPASRSRPTAATSRRARSSSRPAPRRTRTPRSSRGAGAAPAPTRPPAPATAPAAAAARRR